MQQPDRIHLRDYLTEAEIGAFAEERGQKQRLRFGIEAELAALATGKGDEVDDILSYDVLVDAVEGALAARRHDLVESLAEDIAARILAHPAAARVTVTVEKLDRGPFALGVTLTRVGGAGQAGAALAPVRVVVEGAEDWPDTPQGPLVITPAAPGLPLPPGGDQLRMEWLALDQQALSLGARLDLPVVDSRTEIEALLQAGKKLVWAPARMARAAIGLETADPAGLAEWLTAELSH